MTAILAKWYPTESSVSCVVLVKITPFSLVSQNTIRRGTTDAYLKQFEKQNKGYTDLPNLSNLNSKFSVSFLFMTKIEDCTLNRPISRHCRLL